MKKLVFGITSLTLGGAERVLVDIANKLKNEYDITIFELYSGGEFEKDLDKEIKLESMYPNSYASMNFIKRKWASLKVLLRKKYLYKKYIQGRYDIEIAFLEGPITRLFSVRSDNTRKIAWVHNDISKVYGNSRSSYLKRMADEKAYINYDELVFVSNDNLAVFNKEYAEVKRNRKDT